MNYFGSYADMGIHRVDGVMLVLPLTFNVGIENYESYKAPPIALTLFYTPSILEASDVVLDTEQALFISQLRARFPIAGVDTNWRLSFSWSGTDYFTYSALSGATGASLAVEAPLDSDVSVYGEFAAQNLNYFTSTDVAGVGAKIHGIGTWGPFSWDDLTAEVQLPFENDPNNIFSGGNSLNPSLATDSMLAWFGSAKVRIKAVSITFAITNSLDDFTFNRVTNTNSSIPFTGQFGPGRELEGSQIPLKALSNTQPGFLISVSTDF